MKNLLLALGACSLIFAAWLLQNRPAPEPPSPRPAVPIAASPEATTRPASQSSAPVSQPVVTPPTAGDISHDNDTATTAADALAAFDAWTEHYLKATPDDRVRLVGEGVALATARRPVFKQLIQDNPRRAVQDAVPMRIRQELPESIVSLLEERVSGRAALRVYQGVGLDNRSPVPTVRMAEFESGNTYEAHVYGRRTESVLSLANVSLNAIALDQHAAISDDPIRRLEVGERPDRRKPAAFVCPVSGKSSLAEEDKGEPITEETPAIEAFGEIVYLCDGSHATIYREQLIYAEGGTGGPIPFTGILPAAPTPSIGNVKVLVIPMTFADQNDVPSSESVLHQLMRNVGEHYAQASYGKLTLLTTVTPPIKLPHNEAWYIQKDTSNGGSIDGLGLEHSHARAEARKLGFDDDEFDCVVVRLRGGPRAVGGYGGGRSVWIYGDGIDLTAHEIGHSFGLAHNNFWNTSGASAIGVGANEEYGGHWDVMGGIGLPYGHYNAAGKNQIRWLPDPFVTEVNASGLYRIYAQDQAILDPSKRFGLKIRKDSVRTYWGELRGLFTGHATRTWADYGMILGWRYPGAGGSNLQLIDTTPGSPFGKDDSPISLGRTFSDTEAGIHLTTLAVNPATEDEPKSVDVVVNLGAFESNRPPSLALGASATVVPLNAPVTFTTGADDPDGDVLAYSWQHFGDSGYRAVSPNSPVITRTFSAAGTYVVTCTASDMKGGRAIRNVLVTAGNGGNRFTIRGRVTLGGEGLPGVIVNANSANGVITDSDGYYVIPNLSAGTYAMTPLLYGYTFTELFNNSVTVGPGFVGADFEASPVPRVNIAASMPSTAEPAPGSPAQFTLTRTGDAAQALTVNVLGPFGTAERTTDYIIAPAPGSGSQGFSTLTIPAGQETLAVNITPVNDTAAEGPETVTLEIGPGNGYLIEGLARATVVVNDDDTTLPKVSLAVAEAKTIEGSPLPASITFSRTGATTGALAVAYTVAGTAVTNIDYSPLPGTIVIPEGSASATLEIHSLNDAISESLETVVIRIAGSVTSLADPTANSATVSVVDDDVQVLTVVASDNAATEKDLSSAGAVADTATFLIAREGDLSQPLTIYYAVAGTNSGTIATALHGVDYESLPGVLTIPAGQTRGAITIVPRWDGLGEGPESVTLQLGAGPTNYRLGTPNAATITIADAGDPAYVEVMGVDNAVEGGTSGRFRFSLKGSGPTTVVNYIVSGTATSGADFNALSGSVSIPGNGVNTVEVTVTPINDTEAEDLETITLTIAPSSGYQVFPPTGSATIWMRDNEQPTLFVDAHSTAYPPSFTESSSGSSFYISRLGSSTAATTVNYVMSGTAANGVDYQLLSGTATIPAGANGVDIAVTPINDSAAEGTETITLGLAPGAYGRGPAATFYLNDNENPATTISFAAASSTSVESTGTVRVPVLLSSPAATPISVEYLVDTGARSSVSVNGGAMSSLPYWVRCDRLNNNVVGSISADGTNWTAVSTQAMAIPTSSYMAGLYVCSFNSGALSTSVFDNVIVTNLQPGAIVGARLGANIGSTSLAGSASLVNGTYTVAGAGDNVEGTTDQGYFTWFPINNSTSCTIIARVVSQQNTANGATAGVMIRESTANNTRRGYMAATPGAGFEFHYRTASGGSDARVTRAAPRPFWVRLQRAGDFIRTFQSPDGATWTQVSTNLPFAFGPELLVGLAVSAADEGELATATIDNVAFTPGAMPALIGRTVGFTAIQGSDVLVDDVYTISASGDGINGTQDDCYFVSAPVTGDFTITARIAAMENTAGTPQAGLMVRENTRRSSRMVFVGGMPGLAPQLAWRTTTLTTGNGLGIDYTLAPGVLTIPPGTNRQDIFIPIANDTIPEPDEPVTVVLRNATGARLGTVIQHTLVIVDDDSGPELPFVGFASATSSGPEGHAGPGVTVTLSRPAEANVSVDYTIGAGTATDAADFASASGTLNFNAGDTAALIPLTVLDDGSIEASETILLALSNPVGLEFNTITNHTFSILDDDAAIVQISSTDTNASETGDTALVVLTRTGPTDSPLVVNLNRIGTATTGSDYTGINATATIPAGESGVTITLTPVQDGAAEGAETAVIAVVAGTGYVVGAPTALGVRIADDDRNTVTIEAEGDTAVEGGAGGSLVVTRTGNTSGTLTVNLALSGTATSGSDYTTTPSSITSVALAAGQASRTVSINPVNDVVTEGDEAVLVQISAGAYDIGAAGYASVVIRDNDIPPTVFVSSPGANGVVVAVTNGVLFEATAEDDGSPEPLSYAWSQVAGPGTMLFLNPSNAATPATFSAPGVYLVRVTVSDGQFTASDRISVTIGATNALFASDWISSDIGPATMRGFSGRSGSNWVLSATGTGFATSSDRAHAMTRQNTGVGAIVARLTSVDGPSGAEAGLSVRDSMHRYSRRAALVYQASSRTLRLRARLVANTTGFSVAVPNVDLPLWLKLERDTNNQVAAFHAADSAGAPGAWVQVSTNVNILTDATADYSLTGSSGSDTAAASLVFDQVELTPASAGGAMLAEDFGANDQSGSYSYVSSSDVHTLVGQGSIDSSGMFWGQQFTGDFILTAYQTDATSNANDARSGIMVRDSMDNGAMAFVGRNPQSAFSSFVWRTNPGGGTSGLNGITQKQRWLRIIRRGNQITALHAPNNGGVPGAWVQLGTPQTVFLQPTIIAGLYCNNGSGVGFNTATFSRFSVVPLHSAPVVNAGSIPATVSSPLALAGSVRDDGLPSPLAIEWTVANAPGTGAFGDSNALATSFTFDVTGDYTLRLWADDGIARSFDDLGFTFTSGGGFAAWQSANFAGGASNPDAAPDADPDLDGLNNAGEYAFGTNPNAGGVHPVVPTIVTNGGSQFLTVSVIRDPSATDATIVVEASPEVAPATWSASGLITELDTPTLLRVRDNMPLTDAARRFLRIRVTLQ